MVKIIFEKEQVNHLECSKKNMQGKNADKQINKMMKKGYKIFVECDLGVFRTIDFYKKLDFDFTDHKFMTIYPDNTWTIH